MITIIVIFLHPAHHHLSLVIHFQLPSSLLSQVRAWICQRRESRTEPEGSSSNITMDGNSITMDGNTIATSYFSPEHQQGQPPCLLLSQSSAAMVSQYIMLFFLAPYNRPSYLFYDHDVPACNRPNSTAAAKRHQASNPSCSP